MEAQRIPEARVADTIDYCTPGEIAQIAGVTCSAVSNWIAREVGFPLPVLTSVSGSCKLWDVQEVRDWLSGRPAVDRAWMKEYL
jgi:hypothetical protein